MDNVPYIYVKLDDPRCLPKRAFVTDAGADLYATQSTIIQPNDKVLVGTGVRLKIPSGWFGLVTPRSSHGKLGIGLANTVGVIDSDYRGEIKCFIKNNGDEPYIINAFETRIAQILILPVALPTFYISTEKEDFWNNTIRGENGYGSTGG